MASIVVGVDGSPQSLDALRWAAAQSELTGSELIALTSSYVHLAGLEVSTADAEPAARSMLETALEQALGADRAAQVDVRLSPRGPADALLDAAHGAELIVVGPHAGRLPALQLGSITERVITYAECPVAVVRPPLAEAANRIVVGLDGSVAARKAMSWALRQARATAAEVVAVVAWEWSPRYPVYPYGPSDEVLQNASQGLLDDELALLDAADRALVSGRVERGHATAVLTGAAADARLLVVGSRGAGAGFRRLLGSTSLKCVRHATVPVVVVHQPPS